MNTARFASGDDEFELLDLKARFAFKTETSISFDLGHWSNTLRIPGGDGDEEFVWTADRPLVFTVIGWVDVHHPCNEPITAQVRVCLPAEYHPFKRMKAIIATVCQALAIAPEENCQSTFFSSDNVTGIMPRVYLGM